MPYIEDFGKKQAEVAQAEALKDEPQGPALSEILKDQEESRLFSIYLDNNADLNLGMKILTGQLNEQDMLELSEKRTGFLEKKGKANEIKEKLEKDMDRIIEASPDLKKISTVVGKEGIRKALTERVNDLAFTDPDWLTNMTEKYEGIAKTEKDIEWGNRSLADIAQEYGFTEVEYSKALQERPAQPYAFEDLIKSKTGVIGKIFTTDKAMRAKVEELDQRDVIKKHIEALNGSLGELGGALQETLFKNPDSRAILTAELKGDALPEKEVSFSAMNGVLKSYDFKKTQEIWDTYKKEHSAEDGFNMDAEYLSFMDRSAGEALSKKKKGFWATFARLILGNSLEKRIKK
jgi:hypothetical protein